MPGNFSRVARQISKILSPPNREGAIALPGDGKHKATNLREVLCGMSRQEAEALFKESTRSQYLGNDKVLCSILGGRKFFAIASDIGFSTHMIFDGFWEFWLTSCFARHVRTGDTVLDVGANLGYYTVLAAELTGSQGQVISIEPNPKVFEFLQDTINVNGFANHVDLHNGALTDSSSASEIPFFVPRGEPKNGRILSHNETTESLLEYGDVFSVASFGSLPTAIKRLDFVKIDVEGAELQVLKMLQPIISSYKPKVVCEVNFGRGYSYKDIAEIVGSKGLMWHLDYDGEIKRLTEETTKRDRIGDDWLVCHNF
jgi:FkbM family methyltransferase